MYLLFLVLQILFHVVVGVIVFQLIYKGCSIICPTKEAEVINKFLLTKLYKYLGIQKLDVLMTFRCFKTKFEINGTTQRNAFIITFFKFFLGLKICVYVCLCMCVWERERGVLKPPQFLNHLGKTVLFITLSVLMY